MTLLEKLRELIAIVQTDVGKRGLGRVPGDNLVTACPDDFTDACRSIANHPSSRIAIVTGFMIPSVDPPIGETDGPLGAIFLSRVFRSHGIACVLVSDQAAIAALRIGDPETETIELPMTFDRNEMAASLGPISHLIAIERSGPSYDLESIPPEHRNRNRTMRDRDITHLTAPAHLLFEQPRKYTTIGIGDGGNEIGMGKIRYQTICANIPNGTTVACRVPTDYLIVAGVSNWGAYALAAGVMLIRGKCDPTMFEPEHERQALVDLVAATPLIDGVSGERTPTVDGLDWDAYSQPLAKIHALLTR